MNEPNTAETQSETPVENAPDLSRREALERLGKLVGYTAPVALTLLLTPRKAAASPDGPPGWG